MVKWGKCMSLNYEELAHETEIELGMVALRMIQAAIAGWACIRRAEYANGSLMVRRPPAIFVPIHCSTIDLRIFVIVIHRRMLATVTK